MMKRMYMVTVMALVAGMSFPAMANIDLTVDFSVLPTTQGWSSDFGNGGVDPDTQVDTGLQIWDMDNVQPGFSNYERTDHVSLQTGTPTQYHGRVVIDHVDFSPTATSSTEVELVFFKDAASGAQIWLNAVDGGLDYNIGGPWTQIATGLITTGVHTYEWQATISGGPRNATVTTDIWVDGTQIGDDVDMKNNGSITDLIQFGDDQTNAPGSGGGTGAQFDQHHKWHSFHIGQGPIPEPATLTLVGLGSGLMLLRRRRA